MFGRTSRRKSDQSTGAAGPGAGGRALGRMRRDLYSDDPAALTHDTLDRARLAEQVTEILQTVSQQSDSSVVALVGPWGSGKTTLVDDVQEKLRNDGWYTASHNPWAYTDYAGAVAGFFSALRDAVPNEVLGKEWRESLGGWVSRAAPLGAAGGIIGVDASGSVGLVGALIAGDRSPQKLRKEAIDGLTKLEHPVLVVLDDLDRLEPGELLFTFKLVRLLGRLPNVYYLIAYDEQTLVDILMRTQLVGERAGRAQQYLEKMVQVRIDLPPLLLDQQLKLINVGVADLCNAHSVTLTGEASGRLQRAWDECLVHYLDQPRAFKRLFTQVDAFWRQVAGEVDFVDFLLVTFLRTFEKGCFDLMLERRAELLGESFDAILRNEAHGDRWKRWQDMLEERRPRHRQAIAILMSELFLELRSARENVTYGSDYKEDIRARAGIGSAEYFDRYIQIGVPASDLPDQLVAAAAAQLRAGTSGPELEELGHWFDRDAFKAGRKLARIDELDPLPPSTTLPLLGHHYASASAQQSGFVGSGGAARFLILGSRLLNRCDGPTGAALLGALAVSDPSSLRLAGDILVRATYAENQNEDRPWLAEATRLVGEELAAYLRRQAKRSLAEDPDVMPYVWAYRHLVGQDAVRALLWELLADEHWNLPDLLGLLVPVGSTSTGRATWPSPGDFSRGDADALLGLDKVLEELGRVLDAPLADPPVADEPNTEGIDLAARTAVALAALRRIREGRNSVPAPEGGTEDGSG